MFIYIYIYVSLSVCDLLLFNPQASSLACVRLLLSARADASLVRADGRHGGFTFNPRGLL